MPGSSDGLRAIVQERLLKDVFKATGDKWPGWMVLVVDEDGLRMVSSVIGMYQLMENRVTLVENLDKKRAPFKEMAAVYLVEPTEDTIDKIIGDWTSSKRLYGNAVFLYFTNRVPDELMGKIKECQPLLKRIKGFSEINIDFLAKESRAFHLDMRDCFRELFVREQNPTEAEQIIASKLVTLCATLNEFPHIRYRESSPVCQSLAMVFHAKMNEFIARNPEYWYQGDENHKSRDRSVLLLLDRSEDVLTPLMHEFTYQAMVYDLLPIEDDRITYKSETQVKTDDGAEAPVEETTMDKEVLLDENDELWVELRGKHIADVIQTLSGRIRDVVNSNSGAALSQDSGKNLSLSQMATALKALPEYRELMSKLSQHMHISHQCMNKFNKMGMLDLSDLEQTLATGQTDDGRVPKLSELIDQVEQHMSELNAMTKIRLLAILIISQKGLQEEDRDRLYSAAELMEPEMKILENLEKLGVSVTQDSMNRTQKLGSLFRSKKLVATGRADTDSEYASSRYVCNLKTLLEDMTQDRLSMDVYPSVLPMPPGKTGSASSVRTRSVKPTSRWARSDAKKKKAFSGGRQIVFIAGGMCYSEIRSGYEVMASGDREIILGSTCFISPKDFVEDMADLG